MKNAICRICAHELSQNLEGEDKQSSTAVTIIEKLIHVHLSESKQVINSLFTG